MSIYLTLFLIISCCMFDRARGDKFDLIDRAAEQIMYGISIAFCSGLFDGRSFVIAGLWWVGCSVGWGEPLGAFLGCLRMNPAKLQNWQWGPWAKSAVLALVVRGWIWGAPLISAGYFIDWQWYLVALLMPIPVVVAPWIARKANLAFLGSTWEQQEYYRGGIAAALVVLIFWT